MAKLKAISKRKILALAGISLSGTLVVAGCGSAATSGSSAPAKGNSAGGKNITITVYVGRYNADPKAQENLFKNTLIPEFEKANPGVHIKFSAWSTAAEENTSIQTSLATKQGPDIFELGSTLIPTAYATNGFHVFSQQDWNTLGGQKKFFPAQMTMSGPSPDKYIAVPEYMQPFGMVYNKKMFAAAGIKTPPKTWTEFVDDAKKMTNPSKDQWGTVIDPSDSFDPWKIGWGFTKQLGGDFISKDLKTATLDSKESINGLKFWFDWLTKYHIVSPNDLTYKAVDADKAFENGHVGMEIMRAPTMVPALSKSVVKNDYAFAPMPTIPYGMTTLPAGGVPTQTIVSGQYFCIPNYVTGARYQAVLKFLKFLTDVKQQQEFFKTYGYMPANLDAYQNDPELNTDLIKAFIDAEKNASPTPFTGAWGNLEVVYGGVASKIANEIATNSYKEADIANLLKAANAQVQSSLQQ
ncbi:extracellular solute-binding protein [Fodinisporobacter ferrooxydans]|uniref:Extracellular solute-binding protein n=1 Tax=Fodinisporobacter ferrooxydans TaxID=2901836 RepID=A0ABY4CG78_9BACL|nr:extracellular solute-binding protein [Alicyclobacillaceae bacterium MYW30-H2]